MIEPQVPTDFVSELYKKIIHKVVFTKYLNYAKILPELGRTVQDDLDTLQTPLGCSIVQGKSSRPAAGDGSMTGGGRSSPVRAGAVSMRFL